jgi:hypothetical protein
MIQLLQQALQQALWMNDLGEARQYLGAKFEYYPSGIFTNEPIFASSSRNSRWNPVNQPNSLWIQDVTYQRKWALN